LKTVPVLIFLVLNLSLFAQNNKNFDIQGHRGCRAIYPENSLVGFIHALNLGVSTLELDVVISKDKKVVISHDPELLPLICKTNDCKEIAANEEIRIYHLTYDQIKEYDCGCSGNPDFPNQKRISTYKPLLSEMIDSVENDINIHQLPKVKYNIEIKSMPEQDDILTPKPEEFVNLVYQIISEKNILDRVIIQSFDVRSLKAIKNINPEIPVAFLLMNYKGFNRNIKKLGFIPEIYSPYYRMTTKMMIKKAHLKSVKVIPWTVNSLKKINKLRKKGIDGIITDNPEILNIKR
jgi:glycerophosphoryl diester phosphodiesterase